MAPLFADRKSLGGRTIEIRFSLGGPVHAHVADDDVVCEPRSDCAVSGKLR